MPDFSISHETIGGEIDLLRVSGFLDAHTFEQLEEVINNLFSQGRYRLILDMVNVDYISSAGAGVFIAALSEAEENGGRIVLLGATKGVVDVFDLLGLTQIFSIVESREDAVSEVDGGGDASGDVPKPPGVELGLRRNSETGTLFIGGLPTFAFGSAKKAWLKRFLKQPLAKAEALVVDVPRGSPESGLGTILDLASAGGVPVRFLGETAAAFASLFAGDLGAADEALSRYPEAMVDSRVEKPGVLVLRWQGDLVMQTLTALDRLLVELSEREAAAEAKAVVAVLDRKAGGVTTYDREAALELKGLLELRWPGRGRVADFIKGGKCAEPGEEWAAYFPDLFGCERRVEKRETGFVLLVDGVLTSSRVGSYFKPEKPGHFAALRVGPGSFVTPQALDALGKYLKARGKAERPPLVVDGIEPPAEWVAEGWVDICLTPRAEESRMGAVESPVRKESDSTTGEETVMADYRMPSLEKPEKVGAKEVLLIANGDLRLSANQNCWEAQAELEAALTKAVEAQGYTVKRAHPYKEDQKHGFIGSQKEGLAVFRTIDPKARLIVAEAVWQYSHHVLAGLITHEGPILIAANWSGTWPGLVGAVNLASSLTKVDKKYSFLWSEDFATDGKFKKNLKRWLTTGKVTHDTKHVTSLKKAKLPAAEKKLGVALAEELRQKKAIMGVFDEGCMGMFNAIIPDSLLNPTGVYKERLSQSALYYATTQVSDEEGGAVYQWYLDHGVKFDFGPAEEEHLTENQVLQQCKTYVAAVRIADEFGCDLIGIQYQQGLKDLLPASDLVEGTLNNAERPPVMSADGSRELYAGEPLPHFNEVDECCGLDLLMTNRVGKAMGEPIETTLHDVRWGDWDRSGTTKEYVWVFLISGSVPPAHLVGGWAGVTSERQPPMYFRLGGGTIKGISKVGEVIWSRIYIEKGKLWMDLGRGKAIDLPIEETQRRWDASTPQWPIMHAVLYGVTRDQFMAKHKSNHVNLVYGTDDKSADAAMFARAAMAEALGITVNLCGTGKAGKKWGGK